MAHVGPQLDGDRRRVVATVLQSLGGRQVEDRARVLEEDPRVVDARDGEAAALDLELGAGVQVQLGGELVADEDPPRPARAGAALGHDEAPPEEPARVGAEDHRGGVLPHALDDQQQRRGRGDVGPALEPRGQRGRQHRRRRVGHPGLEDAQVGLAEVDELARGLLEPRADGEQRDDRRDAERDARRGGRGARLAAGQIGEDEAEQGAKNSGRGGPHGLGSIARDGEDAGAALGMGECG